VEGELHPAAVGIIPDLPQLRGGKPIQVVPGHAQLKLREIDPQVRASAMPSKQSRA